MVSATAPLAERRRDRCRVDDEGDRQLLHRFVHDKDEAAFAELVRRYGPMVLGVGRRVLSDWHDAEDAFQATFLVLARKSGLIRRPELLANWLYGVAHRVAVRARIRAARRLERERQAAAMTVPVTLPNCDVAWRELRTVLDEEMSRLPAKYRGPLVLCYLQGLTNDAAARRLGRPSGTMSWLLAHGRNLLRKRLLKRGLTLSAGGLALWLAQQTASAAVSESLAGAAVQTAVAWNRHGSSLPLCVTELADPVAGSLSADAQRVFLWKVSLALLLILGVAASVVYGAIMHEPQPPSCPYGHAGPSAG